MMNRASAIFYSTLWMPVKLGSMVAAPFVDWTNPEKIVKKKNAILLLHGSGSNDLAFTYAKSILNTKHEGSVFGFQYDGVWAQDSKASIADFAAKVKDRCDEIVRKTDQPNITIIGVSMGGLIGAYYKEFMAPEHVNIVKVITLASPWHGAPVLDYLPMDKLSNRYSEMKTTSEFVQKLRESASKDLGRYVFIGSVEDVLVPYKNCMLEGGTCIKFEGLGHYSFHAAPSVWNKVLELI